MSLKLAVEQKRERASSIILPALSHSGPTPLSCQQEQFWYWDQMGLRWANNIPIALRIGGELNVSVLERSLTELTCRHQCLRTRFEMENGTPVQVVDPSGLFTWEVCDLSSLPERVKTKQQRRLLHEGAVRGFDLARETPFRVLLLELSEQDYALLMTSHHIVSDGWSVGILVRELGTLYGGYAKGLVPSLPEPPVQYADYAIWQRGWLAGRGCAKQLQYWKRKLDGLLPLHLPTDRPRPMVETFTGDRVAFAIPGELHRRVSLLARWRAATPYMVLLAALKVLLSRWSGQQDIAVGAQVAGRRQRETEGLIGCFINTLLLRTDLSGDPMVLELLDRVRATTLDAYENQELPFTVLLTELSRERDLEHDPLFQVELVLENFPQEPPGLSGVAVEVIDLESEPVEFSSDNPAELRRGALEIPSTNGSSSTCAPLFYFTLYLMEESDGRLMGLLEYETDLFDRETIVDFVARYRMLLDEIVADPARRLSTLRC